MNKRQVPEFRLTVDKDVAISMSDGSILRANVYRPDAPGRFPVVMALGLYGKDAHFADAFPVQWATLLETYPSLCEEGSSGRFLRWENVDPERWVPDGYVVVTVDSRGSGKSPGFLDAFSPQETRDYYEAIEWAGVEEWSNGKVGLIGVSYFAIKQWQVAALQPPHLAAIVPWEGATDSYRDWSHHGGVLSNGFPQAWWPRQVLVNQHGSAASPYRDRETGERTTGPAYSDQLLDGNRADHPEDLWNHPLDDAWHQARTPDLSRVAVPVLSAGNWGGPGLHLRGNVEGFMRAASTQKWLAMQTGTHFESFYLPEYVALQKRFFDHFLKGLDNGWAQEPRVRLSIRRHDGLTQRSHDEWPIAETIWERFYLNAAEQTLVSQAPPGTSSRSYEAFGDGVSFVSDAFLEEVEFTGPVWARLWVESSTSDMDVFLTLRMLDPDGNEVSFIGAHERTPVARGWLRASHRKLDPDRSLPYRPFHAHDEIQKLTPHERVVLDVEIWPTSIVFPKGYRLAMTIQGKDFEYEEPGRILHNDPRDRPAFEFAGSHTIVTGGEFASYLVLPMIPPNTGI